MNPTEQDLAANGLEQCKDGSWQRRKRKLNQPKEFPWRCPKCGVGIRDPELLARPYECPNCDPHETLHLAEWPEKNRTGTGAPPSSLSTMQERLNKTEKRWLAVLRSRWPNIEPGIQDITMRLGFDLRYTPDFRTTTSDGHCTFWEVKGGFEREDAKVKIKMAAAKFPFWTFVKAVWKNNEWTETIVRP